MTAAEVATDQLTRRQFECVWLVAAGVPRKKIAARLAIGASTVTKHEHQARVVLGLATCFDVCALLEQEGAL